MSRLDLLRKNYQRICGWHWDRNVAGPQQVWLAVYDKEDERKQRLRLGLFKETTEQCGKHWFAVDLTDSFAEWLYGSAYADFAESYFESPSRLGTAQMAAFRKAVADHVGQALRSVEPAEDTVVSVYGVASLFGFLKISEILPLVEGCIRGRLLVFFPGVYEQDNYRLLDARDGWNYHAVPITASEGEISR